MNIKAVKEEIKHTVQAYLARDHSGNYLIAQKRQRPVLLMGPPGIGKTAVMEQIARECKIGLVAYTITHHTRQSAVGLPVIREKEYGGKKYQVTEYTMSEIIGSVYDKIEATGIPEGILFIDEINCVSETLAPTMLQFLQAKTFGNHRVPEGWVIVAAGNPSEYNKSVRDFDIVTLDRVKKLSVEADFEVWKEYAYRQNIHESIVSYLEIKKEHFYQIETTIEGPEFVTARGWEDLSELIQVYESLQIPVTEEVIRAYLQNRKIAGDFTGYYELYQKYRQDYQINGILAGKPEKEVMEKLQSAPFDECLSVIGLLFGRLTQEFVTVWEEETYLSILYQGLLDWKERIEDVEEGSHSLLQKVAAALSETYQSDMEAGLLEDAEYKSSLRAGKKLEAYVLETKKAGCRTEGESFQLIKQLFQEETKTQDERISRAGAKLENAFAFLEEVFGESQEMVIFVTELTRNYYSMQFISQNGCDKYDQYNKALLLKDRSGQMQEKIRYILENN